MKLTRRQFREAWSRSVLVWKDRGDERTGYAVSRMFPRLNIKDGHAVYRRVVEGGIKYAFDAKTCLVLVYLPTGTERDGRIRVAHKEPS